MSSASDQSVLYTKVLWLAADAANRTIINFSNRRPTKIEYSVELGKITR